MILSILLVLIFLASFGLGLMSIADKNYSKNGLNLTYPGDMKEKATFNTGSPKVNKTIYTFGNYSEAHVPVDLDVLF